MKAMILAAGFGTRLLPYTAVTPKPLFSLGEKTALEILIEKLIRAGCDALVVNVHHLAGAIEAFLSRKSFSVPVFISREPNILGSGGGVKKVENFWGDDPFLVVNSDIATDIDFEKVWDFHRNHDSAVTLALTDCEPLNSVTIDGGGFVESFRSETEPRAKSPKTYTFTGIQVLEKKILGYIPRRTFYSSIDAFENFMKDGGKIKAYIDENAYWKDIGNEERYRESVFENMAPEAFFRAFSERPVERFRRELLKGDGSDRRWSRIRNAEKSLVCVEHAIFNGERTTETESFVKIGRHLFDRGVPVPEILHGDIFSGFVFVRDLGDATLMDTVSRKKSEKFAEKLYRMVVEKLCHMWSEGGRGFDVSWTWQTPFYDRTLILEKECRYFTDAFLRGYLGLDFCFEGLAPDFFRVADGAVKYGCSGFMHRDFQSRNIMVKGGGVFFIDFQGGRIGPIQYDLASLLIDPYASLSESMRERLLIHCMECIEKYANVSSEIFLKGYRCCALARNLQILGAFSFLSRVKKKAWFEQFIPEALDTLMRNLEAFFPPGEFSLLKSAVKKALAANARRIPRDLGSSS